MMSGIVIESAGPSQDNKFFRARHKNRDRHTGRHTLAGDLQCRSILPLNPSRPQKIMNTRMGHDPQVCALRIETREKIRFRCPTTNSYLPNSQARARSNELRLVFATHEIVVQGARQRVVIITDNAKYHHAKLHKDWRDQQMPGFELDYLPPRNPDLNPIERVWKLTRRLCVHNEYFSQLASLVTVGERQFTIWDQPNNTLRKLCSLI
jgi:hypothetical protein